MPSLNPLYILSLPTVLALTIPFAFFATLTTVSAFTILLLRLAIIYTEIGIDAVPKFLFGPPRPTKIIPLVFQDGPFSTPTSHRSALSSAHSSSVSFADQQGEGRFTRRKRKTSLPTQKKKPMLIDTSIKSNMSAPFAFPLPTAPLGQRDFEGLGGWRFDSGPEDIALFTSINSRLKLPGKTQPIKTPELQSRPIHYQRSATSGSMETISYNSVIPMSKRKRHFSTSSFDLEYNGSTGVGMFIRNGLGRVRSNSIHESPSPNSSKPRAPAILSVTPVTSPEINRLPSKRARSGSENYFSRIEFSRIEGVENEVGLGLEDDLCVKKKISGVSIGSDEAGRTSGSSPNSRRSSGTDEVLNMKMR